jgi:hypothetical protein
MVVGARGGRRPDSGSAGGGSAPEERDETSTEKRPVCVESNTEAEGKRRGPPSLTHLNEAPLFEREISRVERSVSSRRSRGSGASGGPVAISFTRRGSERSFHD